MTKADLKPGLWVRRARWDKRLVKLFPLGAVGTLEGEWDGSVRVVAEKWRGEVRVKREDGASFAVYLDTLEALSEEESAVHVLGMA